MSTKKCGRNKIQPSRSAGQDGSQDVLKSNGNERRNESRPRTPERINAGQDGNQPRKDGCQDRRQSRNVEARIEASSEKFEVLQGALVSRIYIKRRWRPQYTPSGLS
jgi:hypothetical protein